MSLSIVLIVAGLGLVIYFAEKLAKGTVATSLSFGISAFLISVIFIGFDPENLAVGGVASYEGAAGIALGSIIGAAMVAIALAFGMTALLAPMQFEEAPRSVLVVPVGAALLLLTLSLDGELSRVDGGILLSGYVASIMFLIYLSKRGLDIKPTGEVAETLEEAGALSRSRSLYLFVASLFAIILGSEMVIVGSKTVIAKLGLSETVFGMTILALLVSIEELARELPAARKGRPEISYGNVAGSILAFFLLNAGVFALVHAIPVSKVVLTFYLPLCFFTVIVLSFFMILKEVSRWAGAVLIALYLVFFVGGYVL